MDIVQCFTLSSLLHLTNFFSRSRSFSLNSRDQNSFPNLRYYCNPKYYTVAHLKLRTVVISPEQFDYDNGFGNRVGRFKIDLYLSGGDGDCGTWVTSICDKPNKGCHDTREWKPIHIVSNQ